MHVRRSLIAVALLLAVAACSTQGDSGSSTAGQGAGTVDRTVTGATTTPAGGGGAAMREALAREGISDRVLFATDSSELNPEARRTAERWAQLLRQYSAARAVVEGHCDERGTREYNLALGERRATAVKSYLVSLGIQAARLETISYGKEKPAVVGSTDSSWAQNRRAVLALE